MNDIDVGRIRQYNEEYKKCKEKAMQLMAEREMNKKEIDSLCRELSSELGVEVTPDNVGQIYTERVAKINADLALGESIINRIKNEEAQPYSVQQPVQTQQRVVTPQQQITPPQATVQAVQALVQQPQIQSVQPQQAPVVNPQVVMPQTMPTQQAQQSIPSGIPVMTPPQMGNNNGFSTLGNIPQAEIKTEPVVETPKPAVGGFVSQLRNNQTPIIPQMFSRGGGIPSLDEEELEDIDVV